MHMCEQHKSCMCGHRHFFTKEERLERLQTYRTQLTRELEGIEAEIEKLQQ